MNVRKCGNAENKITRLLDTLFRALRLFRWFVFPIVTWNTIYAEKQNGMVIKTFAYI